MNKENLNSCERRKWKVGDRCVVYATLNGRSVRSKGTVLEIHDVRLYVDMDDVITTKKIYAHVKQCRRLRPRRKAREFYIYRGQAYEIHNERSLLEDVPAHDKWEQAIRVREILPKKGER